MSSVTEQGRTQAEDGTKSAYSLVLWVVGGGGVTLDYVRGASLMLSSRKGSQKRKSEGGWRVMCFWLRGWKRGP